MKNIIKFEQITNNFTNKKYIKIFNTINLIKYGNKLTRNNPKPANTHVIIIQILKICTERNPTVI